MKGLGKIVKAALAAFLCLAFGVPSVQARTQKVIVGWVQQATVLPGNLRLRTRIDSGADTASIDARDIQHIQRNGKPWLRFKVTNSKGRTLTIERPEIREMKIKRHGEAPGARPVVTLRLCLGGIVKLTPVNLADRANYNYPLLVGRRFLARDFLIDPGATFLQVPHCGPGAQ